MRTINIFKRLDPRQDGLPGLLFQHQVVCGGMPGTVPRLARLHAQGLAYANPGREFVLQEQGETIAEDALRLPRFPAI